MRKLFLFAVGLMLGVAIGGTLMLLLTPASGKQVRGQVKTRYQDAVKAAHDASEARRKALEAELTTLTGVRLNGNSTDSFNKR
jgi:gas vesicle protein